MKKIAVIGTHGVGKTTLCIALHQYLIDQGHKAERLNEVVRGCPFPLHEKMIYETAEWIALTQIVQERYAQIRNPDYLVCDRSAFDPIPYLSVFRDNSKPYTQFLHFQLYSFLKAYLGTYYKIICVAPSGKLIENDGFRNTDSKIQEKIHGIFHEELVNLDEDCDDVFLSRGPYVIGVDSEDIFKDLAKVCKRIMDIED
jgi:hypothetical protein